MKKQEAIILSMTKGERRNPDIIKASRKKRIVAYCISSYVWEYGFLFSYYPVSLESRYFKKFLKMNAETMMYICFVDSIFWFIHIHKHV